MTSEVKISEKKSVRQRVKDLVRCLDPNTRSSFDQKITNNLKSLLSDLLEDQTTIGAFFPMGHEPRFGLETLSQSFSLGFPVLNKENMMFCLAEKETIADEKKWDYFYDLPRNKGQGLQICSELNALLVPGVAFHGKNKKRLGRGKGYYDKYLGQRTRHFYTIGLCYELQVLEDLPHLDHDMPVDYIVTEQQIYR